MPNKYSIHKHENYVHNIIDYSMFYKSTLYNYKMYSKLLSTWFYQRW